ncbi:MAG: hypothetical protein E7203_05765 [Selenomonas ruminantium]|uniref:Lipoprotein n=1 Tax=Selenomonas ruminantium TaxID=971 RepID=A0A927WI93_SELRU|nr:hypothetical protein [Selenomonas ruminantium]MBE6084965.1 hypothetical protein [Selenomonas ruminantium]
MNTNRAKTYVVFVLLMLGIMLVTTSCGNDEADNKALADGYEREYEQAYNNLVGSLSNYTLNSIEDAKHIALTFDDVWTKDNEIKDKVRKQVINNHSDLPVLLIYAKALEIRETDSYRPLTRTNAELYKMALDKINQIPDGYNGVLADAIKKDKERIKKDYNSAQGIIDDIKAESAKQLHIGDAEFRIKEIYGEPKKINRTVTGEREHKQYVYDGFYIYTDDGIVTAFED